MVQLRWCVSVTAAFVLGALLSQLAANSLLPTSACPPCASGISSAAQSHAAPKDVATTNSIAAKSVHPPATTRKPSQRGPTTTLGFQSAGDIGRKNGEAAYRWVKLPGVEDRNRFLGKVQDFLHKRPVFKDCCPMAVKTLKRVMKAGTIRSMHDELDGVVWGDQHPHWAAFLLVAHAVAEFVPSEGMLLEFGVASGSSIVLSAGILKAKADKRKIFGFDTFTGLPEDWGAVKKGAYAYRKDGTLPPVPSRVSLIKGLFSDTLPGFLKEHAGAVAFINIDCDLYKGAVYVLKQLAPRMRSGTIIHFHELNQNGWADELKALYDFLSDVQDFKLEILDVVAHPEAALVRVASVPETSSS